MSKIDLSFLKHKELPFKTITETINGEEQTFTIYPINGRGITSVGLLSDNDVDRQSKMCLIALMYGLKITQEEAELFINCETAVADSIAAKILKYTQDYQASLNEASSEIKKNTRTKTTK
jgi:hypothetical protein